MRIRFLWLAACLLSSAFLVACASGDPAGEPTRGIVTKAPLSATATRTATASPSATPTVEATAAAEPSALASPSTAAAIPTPTSAPAAGGSQPTATAPARPSAVTLRFRANNLAWDRSAVRVPSGAIVTATMQNDDSGIDHNLSFSIPGLAHGDTCGGPCTRTQTFTAPGPGTYFFLCTIHDMSGTFTVDP